MTADPNISNQTLVMIITTDSFTIRDVIIRGGGMATHVQGKDLVAEIEEIKERGLEAKEEREERKLNPSSREGKRLKRSGKPF